MTKMKAYLLNDGRDNYGVILANSLAQAKKKQNRASKKSDGYIPDSDSFDFEELEIVK